MTMELLCAVGLGAIAGLISGSIPAIYSYITLSRQQNQQHKRMERERRTYYSLRARDLKTKGE